MHWTERSLYALHIQLFTAGLCSGSLFDSKYSWTSQIRNNQYVLQGYSNAKIFKTDESTWNIGLYDTNDTFASIKHPDYPFGIQTWTVTNDPCFGDGNVEVQLNLNACSDSEFNCNDGQCVSMADRCNGVINCHDKTGKF